jgi:hypothetical protein
VAAGSRCAGFQAEAGKAGADRIDRPVFFGEDGRPTLRYKPKGRCGLEIEAGRAWMGNAVYRDLVQGLVMCRSTIYILAVPDGHRCKSDGRDTVSNDSKNTVEVALALLASPRVRMRILYGLTAIGY